MGPFVSGFFPQLLFLRFMPSVAGTGTTFLFMAKQYFIVWVTLALEKYEFLL